MAEVKREHRLLVLVAFAGDINNSLADELRWLDSGESVSAATDRLERVAQATADLEATVEARVRAELAELPDPLDVLGYEQGLEVCERQEGWVVITGVDGEDFHPVALFFDKERAEQYCKLEVDDGCGGTENVAFDACASEAVIVRDRIIVANDYTINDCKELRARVDAALAEAEKETPNV